MGHPPQQSLTLALVARLERIGPIVVGLLLFVAGLMKVSSPNELSRHLDSQAIVPPQVVPATVLLVITTELVLGIGLVLVPRQRPVLSASAIVFLCCATTYLVWLAALRGFGSQCACLAYVKSTAFLGLIRNLVLIAVLVPSALRPALVGVKSER